MARKLFYRWMACFKQICSIEGRAGSNRETNQVHWCRIVQRDACCGSRWLEGISCGGWSCECGLGIGAVVGVATSAPGWGQLAGVYDLPACIRAALDQDADLHAVKAADVALARGRLAEAESGVGASGVQSDPQLRPRAKGNITDPPKENRNAIFHNLPVHSAQLLINIPL